MTIGDINVTNSILNLEHDVMVLQNIINYLMQNNTNIKAPTMDDIQTYRRRAFETLSAKYPNMGITEVPK